jgi:hypothetical protein
VKTAGLRDVQISLLQSTQGENIRVTSSTAAPERADHTLSSIKVSRLIIPHFCGFLAVVHKAGVRTRAPGVALSVRN